MAKRILLVDDEPLMIKGLKFSLEQDGYETDSAMDGEEALEKLKNGKYDLVLLDVMLPKLSGLDVCQTVRATSDVPIIMLTAKGDDMDKIIGLELGADDYMAKPFNMLEVKARIKSIFRRTAAAEAKEQLHPKLELSAGELSINIGTRAVTVRGESVALTGKEFDLLRFLMSNPGKAYSREQLLDELWGSDYLRKSGSATEPEQRVRTVDVHVRRLREKIEKDETHPEYILTQWGVGYYFAK